MLVSYSSNNSGGSWWLKPSHWLALEAAGWVVSWGGTYFCHSEYSSLNDKRADDKGEPCADGSKCPGHRCFDSMADAEAAGAVWLGSLARSAVLECADVGEAVRSFEKATGMDTSDEGCGCCGPPHSFSGGGEYVSGRGCLPHLFPGKRVPSSLREAMESQ